MRISIIISIHRDAAVSMKKTGGAYNPYFFSWSYDIRLHEYQTYARTINNE